MPTITTREQSERAAELLLEKQAPTEKPALWPVAVGVLLFSGASYSAAYELVLWLISL